jgi:hypothetical protein
MATRHHVAINLTRTISQVNPIQGELKLMSDYDYDTIRTYLTDLQLSIVSEDPEEKLFIVDDEERGIKNLMVDCEEPIVIFEQMIMPVPDKAGDMFRRLLQMNRTLVHGAFAIDEESKMILYRDTLQLENIDQNEVQGTIEALSLALAEHAAELISFSRQ